MRFEAPRLLVHTGPPSVSLGSGGVTTLLKGAGQRLAEALRRRSEVVADTLRLVEAEAGWPPTGFSL